MPTLFEKSGAEGDYRRFKFEVAKIVVKDALPGYRLVLEQAKDKREPSVRMVRRDAEGSTSVPTGEGRGGAPGTGAPKTLVEEKTVDARALVRSTVAGLSQKAVAGFITDETLALLRDRYPGWDYQVLHREFADWIAASPERTPANYQAALIGFVKRHDEKNWNTLPRR